MKASELRIGNLIYVDSKLRYVFGTIYKTIQHNCHSKNSTYSENYENECEPIPLTEEWLLKFGFYNSNNEYSLSNVFFYICFKFYKNGNKKLWINSNDVKYLKNEIMFINSVHQLQNLYFALTGEELIIK